MPNPRVGGVKKWLVFRGEEEEHERLGSLVGIGLSIRRFEMTTDNRCPSKGWKKSERR